MGAVDDDLGFVAPAVPGEAAEAAEQARELDPLAELLGPDLAVPDEPPADEMGSLEEEFQRLAALRDLRDALQARKSEVEKRYAAQVERMLQAMQDQGTRQFRSATGLGSCSIGDRYRAKIADRDAFMRWVQREAPELLTVHSQTLTKFVREEFRDKGVAEDNETFPAGVECEVVPSLSLRRSK